MMRYAPSFNPISQIKLMREFVFPRIDMVQLLEDEASLDTSLDLEGVDDYVPVYANLNRIVDGYRAERISVVPWISETEWHFNYTDFTNERPSYSFRLSRQNLGKLVHFSDFYTDNREKPTESISYGLAQPGPVTSALHAFFENVSRSKYR